MTGGVSSGPLRKEKADRLRDADAIVMAAGANLSVVRQSLETEELITNLRALAADGKGPLYEVAASALERLSMELNRFRQVEREPTCPNCTGCVLLPCSRTTMREADKDRLKQALSPPGSTARNGTPGCWRI